MSDPRHTEESAAPDGDDASTLRKKLARRDLELKKLEDALEVETRVSTKLRRSLEKLSDRVGLLEQKLEQVTAERDVLSGQLGYVERMQTATLALDDADGARIMPAVSSAFVGTLRPDASSATISRLMAELGAEAARGQVRSKAAVEPPARDLVAPELMAPEAFGQQSEATARSRASAHGAYTAATVPRLIRLDGESPREYALDGAELTIGRAPEADIRVDELFVSRIHARVHVHGAEVTIEDSGSRNGVKVNSARIQGRQQLQDGDIVGVGRLRLQFIDPGQAPVPEED